MADPDGKPVKYNVVLLAAGRGKDDPMAQAFKATHKALIEVAGQPMIIRVLNALRKSPSVNRIAISIETPKPLEDAPEFARMPTKRKISIVKSAKYASASVLKAIKDAEFDYPVLVTTADHALLMPDIVDHFCQTSAWSSADITVGMAHEDVVKMAYPHAKRTFFKFSDGRFSGCNLFALRSEQAANAVRFWQKIERERKRPWRIVKAFGIGRLATYLGGMLSLTSAMEQAGDLTGTKIEAIRIPFAEAAIDVDKPEDLALAEEILKLRDSKEQLIQLDLDARAEPDVEQLDLGDLDELDADPAPDAPADDKTA